MGRRMSYLERRGGVWRFRRGVRKPPAKTWEEWTTARKRFEQVVGADLPVKSITKAHIRAFEAQSGAYRFIRSLSAWGS